MIGEQQGYSREGGMQMIVQKDVRMNIQLHESADTQSEHSTVSPSDVNNEEHRRQGVCKNVVFLPPELTVVENKDLNHLENQNDRGEAGNHQSTPSSNDKLAEAQLEGGGSSTNDVNKSVNVEGVMCEFKRGGWCKTHKVMGEKIVVSSLKWREDKFGTFRNMKTQQTKYKCKLKSSVHVGPDISTSSKS